MTATATDFDAAIEQALSLSKQLDDAVRALREVTNSLARSVAAKTENLVEIHLVPAKVMRTQIGGIMDAMRKVANATVIPHQIGGDEEDGQTRYFIIAGIGDDLGETRTLWEVGVEGRSGYPITVHGPEEDDMVSCFSEEDVRDVFVSKASHGLVGRKIAALYAYAKNKRLDENSNDAES